MDLFYRIKNQYVVLLIALLMLSFGLHAQSISVKSFRPLEGDMTTTSATGKRIDRNNEVAALIKVVTTETGFTFEAGTLGIVDSQQRNGEIWVWVPRASRKITILNQKFGVLRDYRYPVEIQADRTYEMVLETKAAPEPKPDDNMVRQQYLIFQITPPDAVLEVDDQLWPVAEGTARKFVNFGTYTYRVQAPNYHPDAGLVTIDDPNNKKIVPVNLKPNFGWVEVRGGNAEGAAVYVDNAYIGKAPCKSEALKSGEHTVKIVREMYAPYIDRVTVSDNETTMLSPKLTADFAKVTLTVDADAEIWVNDEKKGNRTWTGDLASGSYRIECRMASHEPSVTTKDITNTMDGQTITLAKPRPIYGSLNVESTPDFANIYIDGKPMGETPNFIPQLLIGSHELKLTRNGYADYTETVTVTKGERKQVNATLSNGKEIQFTCNVPNAQLEIDGQRMSSANGTYMLTYGQHNLRASATDYREYTYTLSVSESSRRHSIQMQALVKEEETFTVNGVSFTMKFVEGGTFQMGATSEQGSDVYDNEKPAHSVTLSSYYIGETEVTQALWKAVMGSNPSRFKGDDLPVEAVSWNDCQKFIRKLNQKTGKNFRLPTEAEWEYAARGGKNSNGYKYVGSNSIGSVAWYTDNSSCKTHPVKGKVPNELGLYDMSGNLYEWCSDWYVSDYYGKSSSVNPQGPSSGSVRVLRGGSFGCLAGDCRVSFRYYFDADFRGHGNGFRLVLTE